MVIKLNRIKHHSIIISDIHLSSPLCKAAELLTFLQHIEVKYLIINGDLFEDLKRTHRLNGEHWKILNQFRKMSDKCILVWCIGNHDRVSSKKNEDVEYIGNLLGLD